MDPVSHIHITGDTKNIPPNSHVFSRTIENADADLYPNRFFGKSTKRYLVIERLKNAAEVISDVCLVDDDDQVPAGFNAISGTFDTREECFKGVKLCLQKSSFHAAQRHVTDVVVTNQKDFYRQNQYTYLGEINNLHICFKQEIVARMVNRNVQQAAAPKAPSPSPRRQAPQPPRIQQAVSPLMGLEYKLSDRISKSGTSSGDSLDITQMRIKTRDDILAEYFYDFSTEEKVLQRSNVGF